MLLIFLFSQLLRAADNTGFYVASSGGRAPHPARLISNTWCVGCTILDEVQPYPTHPLEKSNEIKRLLFVCEPTKAYQDPPEWIDPRNKKLGPHVVVISENPHSDEVRTETIILGARKNCQQKADYIYRRLTDDEAIGVRINFEEVRSGFHTVKYESTPLSEGPTGVKNTKAID